MKLIKLAIRSFFRRGEHTGSRIISLAVGLAFGLLLLSEVFYYLSYDSFYPEAKDVYVVYERFNLDKSTDELVNYPRVSGAIGPGLVAEVPGIQEACRLNSIGTNIVYTEDRNGYEAKVSLADEFVFDLLPRPVLVGNPKEILKTPMSCMISSELAESIGGDVVGRVVHLKRYPEKDLLISGVFEALPENTNYEYDMLISMVSTKEFTWDGTQNWLGNDRYYTCVKLDDGVDPESLAPAVRKMQEVHQNIIQLEKDHGGLILKFAFKPLRKIKAEDYKDMIVILTTISLAVLFVSLMNYILLTLNAMVNRAKSSAVYKTFGAQSKNLQQLIFTETFLIFIISLIGSVVLIAAVQPLAEAQLEHKMLSSFNPNVLIPILLIVIILVIASSYLPGRYFSRIPVASIFRKYKQGRNRWKMGLLAVQFVGVAFILILMVFANLQYGNMTKYDHGYNTEGIYYSSTSGLNGNKLPAILDELRAMSEVEQVGLGVGLPIFGASGNDLYAPNEKKALFNIADFYSVDENFLSILGIEAVQGSNFSEEAASSGDFMISKKGADLLVLNNDWKDGVIGKNVLISEHGTGNICGVFEDFIIHSLVNPDDRPEVFFYMPETHFYRYIVEKPERSFYILVKVNEAAESGMLKKITESINMGMPDNDAAVYSMQETLQSNYDSEQGFRNALMTGCAVIFLISIIGLFGYTTTEGNRRRKELAIRRVNGASINDILRTFILDLEYIALPSVLVGSVAAWFMADKWLQNFAVRVDLDWKVFVVCGLFILVLVGVVSAVNYLKTANRNPVESLRYE